MGGVQRISLVQGWYKWRTLVKMVTNFKVPSKSEEFLGKLWNDYLSKKDSAKCSALTVDDPRPLENVTAKCICLRVKRGMFNPGAWNNFGLFNELVTRNEDKKSLQLSPSPPYIIFLKIFTLVPFFFL
jgi:hypothetical protein